MKNWKKKRKTPKDAVIQPAKPDETDSEEEDYRFKEDELPTIRDKSDLFGLPEFAQLHKALPRRFWFHEPKRLFQTTKDGLSFITFYSAAAQLTPTFLVISDTADHVFGAFTTEEYKKNPKGENVLGGTGETFLFTLRPQFAAYKWSKLNEQFQLSGGSTISFGGDVFGGLWIDSTFSHGRSHTSDTFLNDCLASKPEFDILSFELWTLIPT